MRRDNWYICVLAVAATQAFCGDAGAQTQPLRGRAASAVPAPAAATSPVPAAPSPRQQVAAPDPVKMKQLLRDWERESATLKTLDVAIKRIDKSAAWGDEEYQGRAILRSPNLAWLDFQKVEVEGDQRKLKPHERIVCTGTEVWQYRSDTKQVFIFPLEKQAQKRALEEGPLPFLFNMRAAEAEARYKMDLTVEAKEYYVISVVPKEKIDQESFSKAFLKLNKATYLPDQIFLLSPDGRSTKQFYLSNVARNKAVSNDNFVGKPMGKPWSMVRDPVNDGGANRAAQARPQPQPQPRAPGLGNRQPGAALVNPRR